MNNNNTAVAGERTAARANITGEMILESAIQKLLGGADGVTVKEIAEATGATVGKTRKVLDTAWHSLVCRTESRRTMSRMYTMFEWGTTRYNVYRLSRKAWASHYATVARTRGELVAALRHITSQANAIINMSDNAQAKAFAKVFADLSSKATEIYDR